MVVENTVDVVVGGRGIGVEVEGSGNMELNSKGYKTAVVDVEDFDNQFDDFDFDFDIEFGVLVVGFDEDFELEVGVEGIFDFLVNVDQGL